MNYELTYEDALDEARERYGERELSDDAARVLTAAWYAPSVPAMVAVATGAWSPRSLVTDNGTDTLAPRGEQFREDLWRTFRNETNADEDEVQIVWSMLGTWSQNGGDND